METMRWISAGQGRGSVSGTREVTADGGTMRSLIDGRCSLANSGGWARSGTCGCPLPISSFLSDSRLHGACDCCGMVAGCWSWGEEACTTSGALTAATPTTPAGGAMVVGTDSTRAGTAGGGTTPGDRGVHAAMPGWTAMGICSTLEDTAVRPTIGVTSVPRAGMIMISSLSTTAFSPLTAKASTHHNPAGPIALPTFLLFARPHGYCGVRSGVAPQLS
mmetsp:Transcript_25735/g.56736  ORF Transcript_25735/g.56736 Transcript_25735/m.56736 type:complete len:219 (-) Transcript_25735:9-665(-)